LQKFTYILLGERYILSFFVFVPSIDYPKLKVISDLKLFSRELQYVTQIIWELAWSGSHITPAGLRHRIPMATPDGKAFFCIQILILTTFFSILS